MVSISITVVITNNHVTIIITIIITIVLINMITNIELCHLYPCPCPSQFVEQCCITIQYSWKFVELVRAGEMAQLKNETTTGKNL